MSLKKILRKDPSNIISISGGEPTLSKELFPLLRKICNKFKVSLQTNAILFSDERYVEKLKGIDLLFLLVSLHSHSDKISDALTGVIGSFKKTIQGSHNLLRNGFLVVFNIVINSLNHKYLFKYLSFLNREFFIPYASVYSKYEKLFTKIYKGDYSFVSFSVIQPEGLALKNKFLLVRYSDLDYFLLEAMHFCRKNNIPFTNSGCGVPPCFTPGFEKTSTEYLHLKRGDKYSFSFLNNIKCKIKSNQCSVCIFDKFCLGIWKRYAEIFGLDELNPVIKI